MKYKLLQVLNFAKHCKVDYVTKMLIQAVSLQVRLLIHNFALFVKTPRLSQHHLLNINADMKL